MGNNIKENFVWYLILIIILGMFISLIFYQMNDQKYLLENGNITVGMCVYEQKSLLDYKQQQKVTWVYEIDGSFFKKNTNYSGDIQNGEFFNVYYNPKNKKRS